MTKSARPYNEIAQVQLVIPTVYDKNPPVILPDTRSFEERIKGLEVMEQVFGLDLLEDKEELKRLITLRDQDKADEK